MILNDIKRESEVTQNFSLLFDKHFPDIPILAYGNEFQIGESYTKIDFEKLRNLIYDDQIYRENDTEEWYLEIIINGIKHELGL